MTMMVFQLVEHTSPTFADHQVREFVCAKQRSHEVNQGDYQLH